MPMGVSTRKYVAASVGCDTAHPTGNAAQLRPDQTKRRQQISRMPAVRSPPSQACQEAEAAHLRGIPKTVWLYWEQGWDAAPELVRQCRRSWELNNPDWTVRCLDGTTVGEHFDLEEWMPGPTGRPLPWRRFAAWSYNAWQRSRSKRLQLRMIGRKRIHVQGRSDILRLNLLARYGGVWADATLWCHRPLDDWLGALVDSGFFAFHNGQVHSRRGEALRFTSWLLAARRNHYLVRRLLDAARVYWARRSRADEYFWLFVLVERLYADDPEFQARWEAMPRVEALRSAPGPRYFAPFTDARLSGLTDEYLTMIVSDDVPVFKLRHRRVNPLEGYDRIEHLFATLPTGPHPGAGSRSGPASPR